MYCKQYGAGQSLGWWEASVGAGKRGRRKDGKVGGIVSQRIASPPRPQALQPPNLPPPFLVLFQAPDLLQEPASLLPQAHNLLVSIPVILSPPHQGTAL